VTSMATVLQHKVVAALPSPLEPDSIYYVRVGQGFDVYVTNGLGEVVAYDLNVGLLLGALTDRVEALESGNRKMLRFYDAQNVRHYLALNQHLELPIQLADGSMDSVTTIGAIHG